MNRNDPLEGVMVLVSFPKKVHREFDTV